ncbi:MAG: hypothetical protein QOE28_1701, partial [Solirubrobacteraceae bacterium]|nr:hypothetical protein [Solirubrobacteraceae bacterium]
MFERFKQRTADPEAPADARPGNGRATAVADRPASTRDRDGDGIPDDQETTRRHRPGTGRAVAAGAAGGVAGGAMTREHMQAARVRQREEFGGINWGASFFGWLVAVGLGTLLVAILVAAGAAVGLTNNVNVSTADATNNAGTIGLGGGIALLVVLMIAYYAGGYVAGRMSRFDG